MEQPVKLLLIHLYQLEKWREQVCEPADELLFASSELVPGFRREFETVSLVIVKHVAQFLRGARIDNDGIFLVVEIEAARVKIGTSHRTETTIDHDDFGVMESRFVDIHIDAVLHELMNIVEHAIRGQRNVALGRHHDFYFHTTLDGIPKRLFQFWVERQIRIDELDAVLSQVDCVLVESPDNGVCGSGLTVDDTDHLSRCSRASIGFEPRDVVCIVNTAKILWTADVLMRCLVPNFQEDRLQGVHLVALNAAVHVTPFSHLWCAVKIVVGNIHTAGVSNLSIDNNYFPVITMKHVVYPRESQRVEFIDFYT